MIWSAKHLTCISALALGMVATPAMAAEDKQITDKEPGVVDVAKTPVTDLNLDKQEIPGILIAAQNQPYRTPVSRGCPAITEEIEAINEVIGPDLDLPETERARISAGGIAKSVVGSFIPFRNIIREVSGANDHERRIKAAVQAGVARRGFLKGLGLAADCEYPARPANGQVIAAYMAHREAREATPED